MARALLPGFLIPAPVPWGTLDSANRPPTGSCHPSVDQNPATAAAATVAAAVAAAAATAAAAAAAAATMSLWAHRAADSSGVRSFQILRANLPAAPALHADSRRGSHRKLPCDER